MRLFTQQVRQVILWSMTAFLLSSCSNTKITQSWVEPDNKKSYSDLLIIGIAESEQNRRAYESYFVEELGKLNIHAEASYKLIKSDETIKRETVLKAIDGLGIDGVIVTHLVAVDEETVYHQTGYGYGGGYGGAYGGGYGSYYGAGHYGGLYSYYPYVNSYVHDPGYYATHETYTLETTLYDVKSEELVWTARSRTFSPESVDEVIVDLTKLLLSDLEDKGLIKSK